MGFCFVAVPALDGAGGTDFLLMVAKDRAEAEQILAAAAVPGWEKAEIHEGVDALDAYQEQYPDVALLTTL